MLSRWNRGGDQIAAELSSLGFLPDFTADSIRRDSRREVISTKLNLDAEANPFILQSGLHTKVKRIERAYGTLVMNSFSTYLSEGVVWPGNIISSQSARDKRPEEIADLKKFRAPGKITLAVVNGSENLTEELTEFSKSEVYEKLNRIVSGNSGGLSANSNLTVHQVRSQEEVRYLMRMSGNDYEAQFGDDHARLKWEQNTLKYFIKLDQVFFTVLFDEPDGGGLGLFRKDADLLELLSVLQDKKNRKSPLAYVSSVSYGRSFVMLLEEERRTIKDSKQAESDLEKIFSDPAAAVADADTYNQKKFYIRQIGGKSIVPSLDYSGGFEGLYRQLVSTANLSLENVAAPMAYTLKYLSDGSAVTDVQQLNSEYSYIDYEPEENLNEVILSNFSFRWEAMSDRTVPGGNYDYISHHSRVWVDYVNVIRYMDGEEVENKTVYSSGEREAREGFDETVQFVYNSGKLGQNPTNATITLEFKLTVYTERYNKGMFAGSNPRDTKSFTCRVEFRYDPAAMEWRCEHFADTNLKESFRSFGINTVANFSPVNFKVNYRFQVANRDYSAK